MQLVFSLFQPIEKSFHLNSYQIGRRKYMSRLLMNLILLRNGFVIANIKGDLASRKAYYRVLETAQADQSKSTFINLVLDQEIEALERYIKIIGVK